MRIEIYHANDMIIRDSLFYRSEGKIFNEVQALDKFKNGFYNHVGSFDYVNSSEYETEKTEAIALEYAYSFSQNDHSPWNTEKRCRSTSVGDILTIGKNIYITASEGFELIGKMEK